ncbi:MAG: nuclear transport factor 2 family protein, partial [Blastocatellia bacterium]|nr:nuclear transport factor 2 family protein [Blastocatellia bacterium]
MDIHKIATEVMAAWNNKDLEKLAALYNEEVVFFDPLLAKEIRGKAIIDYAASIFAAFPDVHFVIKSE